MSPGSLNIPHKALDHPRPKSCLEASIRISSRFTAKWHASTAMLIWASRVGHRKAEWNKTHNHKHSPDLLKTWLQLLQENASAFQRTVALTSLVFFPRYFWQFSFVMIMIITRIIITTTTTTTTVTTTTTLVVTITAIDRSSCRVVTSSATVHELQFAF